MAPRKPKEEGRTLRSVIKGNLRRLFVRSKERAFALKREGYCCEVCKAKQSKAKGREVALEVHHRSGKITNWAHLIDEIQKELLCNPNNLKVLCEGCHGKEHAKADIDEFC